MSSSRNHYRIMLLCAIIQPIALMISFSFQLWFLISFFDTISLCWSHMKIKFNDLLYTNIIYEYKMTEWSIHAVNVPIIVTWHWHMTYIQTLFIRYASIWELVLILRDRVLLLDVKFWFPAPPESLLMSSGNLLWYGLRAHWEKFPVHFLLIRASFCDPESPVNQSWKSAPLWYWP